MEDLTENPEKEWLKVFDFLELIDPSETETATPPNLSYKLKAKVNRALKYQSIPESLRLNKAGFKPATISHLANEKYSFKKLSGGRKAGQENTNSHYRKGKRGDWRNHFSEAHKVVFKEKYGDLLIKLGYETDKNW